MEANSVIVTTPAELQSILHDAVQAILPELAKYRAPQSPKPDTLNVGAALECLAELGSPTTQSSLYNLVFKGSIPFRKVGKRLLFSRKDLTEWVESRTTRPDDRCAEAAQRLAKSVTRKSDR